MSKNDEVRQAKLKDFPHSENASRMKYVTDSDCHQRTNYIRNIFFKESSFQRFVVALLSKENLFPFRSR